MRQIRTNKNSLIFSCLPPESGREVSRHCSADSVFCNDMRKESVTSGVAEFKPYWQTKHRRFYRIAGITIQIDADLPITDATFHAKFRCFEVDHPGGDTIFVHHLFGLPDLYGQDLGKEVYRRPPWIIFRNDQSWVYLKNSSPLINKYLPSWLFRLSLRLPGIPVTARAKNIHQLAVFNDDHTRARIYNASEEIFQRGGFNSLTLFPTDQILLARILADRNGCFLHSAGITLEDRGFLFVGHSGAGKSTLVKMLQDEIEVLCDDRMIIRGYPHGFNIYGTWSHGEVKQISSASASLNAIFFLQKSRTNRLVPIEDRREVVMRLLACLIKPYVTADWWDNMLTLIEKIAREVPCYDLHFDKSGQVVDLIKPLWEQENGTRFIRS